MQNEWCYIQNSSDFTKKVKHLKNIADNALLVFPDVAIFYPNAPHWVGLRALTQVLDRREEKQISTEDFIEMTEFVI